MSVTIVTLIEETKEFQLKKLLLFWPMNMKTKWFFQLFRQEDQVITALIANSNAAIKIFTLDTGRLFQETYDVFIKR
jgi:phosphoadenosine phosphosulfate reductase